MSSVLRAPFPWFGGKSRAADLIWKRLGDVRNYCEPFAGSLAVLLARPTEPKIETVNDLDCYLANFWRAVAWPEPVECERRRMLIAEEVARWCDWPVNEADLHARHKWLLAREEFRTRMRCDPEFFDPKIAGWWVWGLCAWIGSGWCSVKGASTAQVRHLSGAGQGIHGARFYAPPEKLPMLAKGARGVLSARTLGPSEQLPHLWNAGRGANASTVGQGDITANIIAVMNQLHARLRRVRVACGDWIRILSPAVTTDHGLTGVLLDPPYSEGADDLYANHDKELSTKVRQWAIEHGDHPRLRIALCGYEGEHQMPDSWTCVAWKAQGGYGSDNGNPYRERIWFSPHCLRPESPKQYSLFGLSTPGGSHECP